MANASTPGEFRQRGALTPRQREILALVASGMSSSDVAKTLGITPATVKTHLTTIYKEIGVRNRVQATRYYLERRVPSSGA